jgi:peptidoglycan lytic transglycosylase
MNPRRPALLRCLAILIPLTILPLLLTGCGHPKQARVNVPPPPAPASAESPAAASAAKNPPQPGARSGDEKSASDIEQPTIPAGPPPLATEIGRASWYGPPYHNRRGSNGEIYDMNAMTAAHRTLPLGSIVRVTNLKTGHTATVRITDRGPFIRGRVLDLSLAAARKVDVYQPGVAEVKLEVMQTPVPIETGGKWAVQIGGFPDQDTAANLADHLTRRYHTAKVQRFNSPAGRWWVLVRVPGDDRQRAQELAAETQTPEGAVFLVRLD